MTSPSSNSIWLYRYSLLVVFATVLLILAGGLVTSHEAGLAVPDWPLSYGQMMPPMVGNVFWEHGHRMIAGTVGILTLVLTLWVQFGKKCARIKKLAWLAMGAVVLQALLGGLTVILLLPPAVSIFHACLAQTFLCLLVALAFFLSPPFVSAGLAPAAASASNTGTAQRPWLFKFWVLIFAAVYVQLILGAIVRHTSPSHAVVFHVIWAFVVIGLIFLGVRAVLVTLPERQGPARTALTLGLLVIVQFFLGLGAFLYTQVLAHGYAPRTAEIFFASAHHTNGALVLALSLLLTLQVRE